MDNEKQLQSIAHAFGHHEDLQKDFQVGHIHGGDNPGKIMLVGASDGQLFELAKRMAEETGQGVIILDHPGDLRSKAEPQIDLPKIAPAELEKLDIPVPEGFDEARFRRRMEEQRRRESGWSDKKRLTFATKKSKKFLRKMVRQCSK